MADAATFQQVQKIFTAHLRDPERHPAPADVEDRRMAIYRELFYHNVESFMADSFPLLRALFDEVEWHALIRAYFAEHKARTPLFPQMPREFVAWLEQARPHAERLPFLVELAHFEWMELAVALSDDEIPTEGIDTEGDLLADAPVLSPLARLLVYRYPVHRITPDNCPREAPPEPTCLIVYRDRDDDTGFLAINPITARLVELLQNPVPRSGRRILEHIAAEIGHPQPDRIVAFGLETLGGLRQRDIVLGTRPAAVE